MITTWSKTDKAIKVGEKLYSEFIQLNSIYKDVAMVFILPDLHTVPHSHNYISFPISFITVEE